MANIKKMFVIGRINRTDVLVHWSVFVISGWILIGAIKKPVVSLVGLSSYLGVMFLHEVGHMIAAHRRGSAVWAIEIYPLWGLTRYEQGWSRIDRAVIAWGGVVAQLLVAMPILIWVGLFGYSQSDAVNVALALFGGFSLLIVVFNLFPGVGLDGATAWDLFPALLARRRGPKVVKKTSDFRTY
jgi:Zn-dependent protease